MSKKYSFIDCNYFTEKEDKDKNMFKNAIQEFPSLEKIPKDVDYYDDVISVKDVEKGE